MDRERRPRALERAASAISDRGHEWDEDPAAWVRAQRRSDPRRVGCVGAGAVLLDTTVLIDYLRGRAGAVRRVAGLARRGDEPLVCAISVEEVTRGLRAAEDDTLVDLLEGVMVAPLGIPEGRLAGYWRRTHGRRGRSVAQSHALIAAAAVGVDARVATGNPRDFRFPGVLVEHWPVGE